MCSGIHIPRGTSSSRFLSEGKQLDAWRTVLAAPIFAALAVHIMPDATMLLAAADPEAELPRGKGGKKRAAESGADLLLLLSAQELPAHLRQQLEEALSAQVKHAANEFEATAQSVVNTAREQFLEKITAIAIDFNTKHERTERDLADTKIRVAASEVATKELRDSVGKLEKIVAEAESRNPSIDVANLGTWDRAADPCTFWFGAASPFGLEDLKRAIAPWLANSQVNIEQVSFNSTDVLRRHSFTLTGGTVVAEPRARRLHDSIHVGRIWRDFNITSGNSAPSSLYVSADKSPRTVRREVQLKRLGALISKRFDQFTLRLQRSQGYITYENEVIVQLLVGTSPDELTKIRWTAAAVRMGLNADQQSNIRIAFENTFSDALASAQWL